jgi:hypothetical protein
MIDRDRVVRFLAPCIREHAVALVVSGLLVGSTAVEPKTLYAADMSIGAGDCAAAGVSTAAITNACNSNSGSITLYVSFQPPSPMGQFEALIADVDIYTSPTSLSPWWHMEQSPGPGCRAGKISVNANFTSGPTTCTDFWSGQATAGMVFGVNDLGLGPNTANIRVVAGVPEEMRGSINSGTDYYAFSLTILKTQSTGPGSCAGCSDRACFSLSGIALSQPAPIPDQIISKGVQTVVTYNGGTGGPNCAAAVVQRGSWGAIKAIYR